MTAEERKQAEEILLQKFPLLPKSSNREGMNRIIDAMESYAALKVAEAMPTEEGYILYEKAFLSPIKEERAWQEHCLRLLYAEYPNICKWQLMSSLIYHTGIATGITIPSYDEWFRNRMKGGK